MASSYGDLSEKLRQMVCERVDDEYGLALPQLWIVNISVPEEVEKALDARTSMGVIGNLAMYQHYQLGHSMPVAAANPAGGLAGAGVGVGMGMAVAGQMLPVPGGGPGGGLGGPMIGGAPTGATPGGAPVSAAPGSYAPAGSVAPGGGAGASGAVATPQGQPHGSPPPTPAYWHIVEDGQTVGPLTTAQVVDAVVEGRVQPETLVWTEGMEDWLQASQLPQLGALFESSPPPPPPRHLG